MSMGIGYHRESEKRLHQVTVDNAAAAPVVTSAGALVDCLKLMKAKKIVVVTPYMKPLTELVVNYIAEEGFEILDYVALEIADNIAVAQHDPADLPNIVQKLNYQDADVIVLSACVQMQSLPAVAKVEALTGKPVISAAIATTYQMLKAMDLEPIVPGAGALLSGAYA